VIPLSARENRLTPMRVQRSRFSMSLIYKRISMKVLDMKYSGLVYVWGGLEGR
jgi:hypothetical protein